MPEQQKTITDLWFYSPLPLLEISRRLGLQDVEEGAENHWHWVVGRLGDCQLDITRMHSPSSVEVDTRIFKNEEVRQFSPELVSVLVDRLQDFISGAISCGQWVYRSANDFELISVEEFPPSVQRLFCAQIVVLMEDLWFAPQSDLVTRSQVKYQLACQIIMALDAEDAYKKVQSWIEGNGFSDSNHDGLGDLTRFATLGIHEIEEIDNFGDFRKSLADLYGAHLPGFNLWDVDEQGRPLVRSKEQLDIFRHLGT